ncbi:MAG: PilZ domain-containing protein [bacterium]
MANPKLEDSYQNLLRKSQLSGEAEAQREESERRQHPRIHVDAADIQVDTDSWIFVINLSVSGIAFYSDSEFTLGQQVTISTETGASVKAKVIEAHPEGGDDATSLVGQYRVCCQFDDPTEGMAFLLGIKESEEKKLGEHLP